jgi:outer membrane lipoprotein
MSIRFLFIWLYILTLAACATNSDTHSVFNTEAIDQTILPNQVIENIESARGERMLWGGMIISSTNLEGGTQLEVLAYPLDDEQKPDIEQPSLGRILVETDQYLESIDFAPIRLITASGNVADPKTGHVGSSEYIYPVLAVDQIHLWTNQEENFGPRVNFGFGFILSN